MKKIAIITGASSGMGKQFALTVTDHYDIDELWVIARDKKNLEKLKDEINIELKIFPLDLTDDKSFDLLKKELKEGKYSVELLVNASGFGKFEKTTLISEEDNIGMINLNCIGLTKMCLLTIPYMHKGSKILNISSVAAFQPVPYINVYAASKAYVLSFSRSLNQELKKDEISVTALCPFWTKTKFFDRAVTKNQIVKKYVAMYEPKDLVKRAWRDLAKGKDVSKYGFIARGQVLFCKILPHSLVMNIWQKQQKL